MAVVGSGLAGLSVAHLLSLLHTDDGHGEAGIDVHLFEKAHKLGKRHVAESKSFVMSSARLIRKSAGV